MSGYVLRIGDGDPVPYRSKKAVVHAAGEAVTPTRVAGWWRDGSEDKHLVWMNETPTGGRWTLNHPKGMVVTRLIQPPIPTDVEWLPAITRTRCETKPCRTPWSCEPTPQSLIRTSRLTGELCAGCGEDLVEPLYILTDSQGSRCRKSSVSYRFAVCTGCFESVQSEWATWKETPLEERTEPRVAVCWPTDRYNYFTGEYEPRPIRRPGRAKDADGT